MVLFNLKHWKTQILAKGSTLNQPDASKKNCQGHSTNLLVKQPKSTTPRLHAMNPVTLNFQTYLKMLKIYYLALIPVKPLEWTKYQQNFSGTGWSIGSSFEKYNNFINKIINFPEECKIAKLKPIFKKVAGTDPKNYRPISLLPLVSEINEN